MTPRLRSSKGKEKCCFVSGIWGVAFFVLKKAWNKQNLQATKSAAAWGDAPRLDHARATSLV